MKELPFDTQHKTKYCIPLVLRDEQIKSSVKKIQKHLQPYDGKREEPIAIVCYGPSLLKTWPRIKRFKHIITCSGAHQFLLDKGLSPRGRTWYHVEVDPRPHKIHLVGKPRRGVKYLISSTCHPAYLDHLSGFDTALWHVFDNDNSKRLIPRGEWAVTGGPNVGLRAMSLARFMGYYKQHVFGMDGCKGAHGLHAGEHPNQPKDYSETTFKGKKYLVTPSLLECAKAVPHEMDMLPDVQARFHGTGLVQSIMRGYKRKKPKKDVMIGVSRPILISEEYRALNQKLHESRPDYGISGHRHADVVLKLVDKMHFRTVLDYGCGKGTLGQALPFPIWEYDPAIAGKDAPPREAELVVCADVLEHIEPDKIGPVLEDLARVTRKVGYFVVNTGPAQKFLEDGRNAHLIQKDKAWWERTMGRFFKIGSAQEKGADVIFIVGPR